MLARFLAPILALIAAPVLADTLHYVNEPTGASRHVTLHRDGGALLITDAGSGTVVASRLAATTDRVVIEGADGQHQDTLTIDLTEPFTLARGIDYDGGLAGWDTLVLQGGSARNQRVTQLTPSDGVIEIDGLAIRYTNLEPITDTAPAANYTIVGTAGPDPVTISDGPGGTTTVSSPTFESVTFANKTNVVFDGLGGGDSVSFNNPTPATGLSSLIVMNVHQVMQFARVAYPSLGINATGPVDLQMLTNDADRVEITTQNGNILFYDADDLIVGGVSPLLAGVRAVQTGHISVGTLGGNLTLDDTDGAEIIKSGDQSGGIGLNAGGGTSDLIVVPDRRTAVAPAGSVSIQAFGDVLLGTGGATYANDVMAATSVQMSVQGTVFIGGQTRVISDAFGTNSGGDINVGTGGINQTGSGRFLAQGTAGADVELGSGTGSYEFLGQVLAAESVSGDVLLLSRGITIAPTSGASALAGRIMVRGHGMELGTVLDVPGSPVELSDAEVDRLFAPVVEIEGLFTVLHVTAPITFTNGNELILRSTQSIAGSALGSVSAPVLTLEIPGSSPTNWQIVPGFFTTGPGPSVGFTNVTTLNARGRTLAPELFFPADKLDAFAVAPHPTTTINIDGSLPIPPASPGDVLDFDLTGVTNPVLTATFTANGYQGSLTSSNRQPVNFQAIEQLVDAPVNLGVTKTASLTTVVAGTALGYSIAVTNPAPIPVAGATVTDLFPAGLTDIDWTCAPSAGSTCAAAGMGNINDTVTIAANGSLTYTVTATVSPSENAPLSNTVTVTTPSGYTETDATNDSSTAVTPVTTEANLVLQKSAAPAVLDPGQEISYTITLVQNGPSDAQSVTLTDALPANTSFVSLVAPIGYSCTTPAAGATGTVTCTRAVLPPSTTDTFVLTVLVDPSATRGTTVTNTASVASVTTDPTPGNSTATAAVLIGAVIPALSPTMMLLLAGLLAIAAFRATRAL